MAILGTTIADLVPSEKGLAATVNLYLATANQIVTSGLAVTSPVVDTAASGGPRKVSIPFIKPLDTSNVPNISSDDITADGNTGKQIADEFTVLRNDLNMGWGYSDLVQMITGYDANGGIAGALAAYWAAQYQVMATNAITACLSKNAGFTYTSASAEDTYKSLVMGSSTNTGDKADLFDIAFVSPSRYAQMRVDNKNSFVPASQTQSKFDEYAGFKLIKTSAFGANVSVVARSGSLAFGTGTPAGMVPIEVERLANKGTGGGANILHSRQSVIVHPQGFSYTGAVAPTIAALATAGNWTLSLPVGDLEQIGFRKVIHTA